VLVLQEPKLAVKPRVVQPPSFHPYNCVYFPHTRVDTGIIFYIHPSIMFEKHEDTPHCSDYNPERKTTTVAFVTLFSEALTEPLILAGAYIDNSAQVAHIKAVARRVRERMRVAEGKTRPEEDLNRQMERARTEIRHLAQQLVVPPTHSTTLEVQDSHIPDAGLGLFTKVRVAPCMKVCDYLGEVFDRTEFKRRYPDGKAQYVVSINSNTYVDAVNTQTYGRYANCRHNHNKCTFRVDPRTKQVTIWTKSGCTLEPGEEIYVSYRNNYTLPRQQPTTQQPSAPHLLLIGDMNASFPAWDPDREATALGRVVHKHMILNHDNMMAHKMSCLNTTHTRGKYTHTGPLGDRVIDLAMTTRPDLTHNMEVLYTNRLSSDHYPIRVTMHEHETHKQQRRQRRLEGNQMPEPDAETGVTPIISHLAWRVDTMNTDEFAAHIKPTLIEWMRQHEGKLTQTATLTLEETTQCWVEMHERILAVANDQVGKKRIHNQSKHWWNRQGRKTVHQLYIKYKDAKHYFEMIRRRRGTLPARLQTARDARNQAHKLFRTKAKEEKQAAEEEFAASLDEHQKVAWSQFRRAVPRVFTPLASFRHPTTGDMPARPQQAINNLATHLAAVSTVPQDPSFDTSDDDMIEQEIQDMISAPPDTRQGLPFTRQQLRQAIPTIRLKTALGTDDISPYFIKHGGDVMIEALYMLFEISYSHGHIPAELKHGKVAAIYKQTGRKDDPSNYRPIAVTSVVMRLWERMMKQTTIELMAANDIPALSQFGFTAKRSTYDAMYRFLSTTVGNFDHFRGLGDRDKYSPAVFIDVSKAYDTVWIQGLLYKLKRLNGMTPHLLRFFTNFLTSRTMAVHHSGLKSAVHTLLAGVPQGCVLGPFLYTIYVHDIKQGLHKDTLLTLFADDMALQPVNKTGTLATKAMRASLTVMTRYACKWKIKFSTTKTNVVFFRPPRHTLDGLRLDDPLPSRHRLQLGGASIATAKEYKYLGVLLDQHLTYLPHLSQLVTKTTMASHMICRLIKRDKLPSFPVIRQLVSSVLIPKMTYGFPFIRLPRIEDDVKNPTTSSAAVTVATAPTTATQARPARGGRGARARGARRMTTATARTTHVAAIPTPRRTTQHKKTNNIARQLKNVVIRPLRLSLGLPHSAHHHSVLIESRLMPMQSIQTYLTAMCVTRWKGLEDTDNAGADKYIQDEKDMKTTTASKYSEWHPCRHISSICKRVAQLAHVVIPSVEAARRAPPDTTATLAVPAQIYQHVQTSTPLHLCVYTDGASRGNPGPSSCGGVIYRQEDRPHPTIAATAPPVAMFSQALGTTTNNVAEFTGVVRGIEEAIKLGATHVHSYVDSQLVCRQVLGQYAVRHPQLVRLHDRCTELTARLERFTIEHTLRANNAEADRQCNMELDSINAVAPLIDRQRQRPADIAWNAFCDNWFSDKERSLVAHYNTHVIDRKKLPIYTTCDTPAVTAKRARLRFRRALFGFNNKRMNFADSQIHCDAPECTGQDIQEDTQHVLMVCPRHARDRDKMTQRMAALADATGTQPATLSLPLLLNPLQHDNMKQLSKITGRFLLAVNRNKVY
jgi:ribonuclease HI